MDSYRYKAFISYRHQAPDQDIARKLHKDIENFGIPSSLKKTLGISKMGRVFRDQDELLLSSDLGDDIHEALEQSEWLICICSPRYLESRWCLEEVRYFLSLGRRDRILTVLAEGEPDEAFPEELRFKEENGERIAVEPLAADVRGATVQESLKKLSAEKLRILAPMLGVNYDDLKQRAKQRRNRILAGAAAALILALSGFLGYAFHKNAQITAERNDALIAESKWLAQSADEALESGDRMLSMLLSLEALPEDFDHPERPVTEEALASLRSAIISGQGDSVYQEVTCIRIPGLETWRAQDNLLLVFSRQINGCLTYYDLNTGQEIPVDGWLEEEPAQCLLREDLNGFAVYQDRIENLSGSDLTKRLGTDIDSFVGRDLYYEWSENPEYRLYESDYSYLLLQANRGVFSIYMAGYDRGYRDYADEGLRLECAAAAGKGSEFLLAGYRRTDGGSGTTVLRVNVQSSAEDNVIKRYVSETYVEQLDVSKDGNYIAGWREGALFFWNAAVEEPAVIFDMERLEGRKVEKVEFSGRDSSLAAILCPNGYVYLYDCSRDEIRLVIPPGLYQVKDLMWSADGSRLLLSCSDDSAHIVSAADGSVVQTLVCPSALKKAAYGQWGWNDCSRNDTFVLLEGEEEICVYRLTEKEDSTPLMTRLNDKLSVMSTVSDNTYRIRISEDGSRIWNYHGDGLHVYDAQTGEVLKIIEGEDTASTLLPAEQFMISYHSSNNNLVTPAEESIRIYDPDTFEAVQKLYISYPHESIYVPPSGDPRVTQIDDEVILSKVFLNEDASMLFAVGSSTSKYPSFFAFRTDSWEESWRIGLDWGLITDRLFDFAADWQGFIKLDAFLLPESGNILCTYTYMEDPDEDFDTMRNNARAGYSHQLAGSGFEEKCSRHVAAEVRDAQNGEVLQVYELPYTVVLFYPETEYGILIAQDDSYDVHIVKAETGEELALCEADSRIFDYAAGPDGVKIRYELFGTIDRFASRGHAVSMDGTVQMLPAGEIGMPAPRDGVFGERPFVAEEDGLYDAETGETIVRWDAGQYYYLGSWEDGRAVLLFAPFVKANTKQVNGDVVILRWADGSELRSIARQLLGERELSEVQKETYFLK
ncbi:MAG: TIR domain-containing protein [Firmicutes bacterium]|nr:TIR domain-containing protein [Bacillota bacterium]